MNNKRSLQSLKTLTVAAFKMYVRNRGAIIFTFLFPIALLAVFGFLSKSNSASVKLDLTNYSSSDLSHQFVDAVKKVPAFEIKEVDESVSSDELGKGKIDLQVIVPQDFGQTDGTPTGLRPSAVVTHYNAGKPQNGITANLIITQIVSSINNAITHAQQLLSVDASGVKTNNLGFFDFILPGILGMTIMQLGIFGVSFAFVSLKASGALRRLQATPIHPVMFVVAQAIVRLVIALVTVLILMGLGIKIFGFHMLGSYWSFGLITVLGTIVFLGIGFAIAGWAKDENQVAPLANVIQLPMLLLSGIFFPRDAFPGWLHRVTDFFPLTYLGDALRRIANEGAHLIQIKGDILGLLVWGIVIFVIAVNVFRWE